MRRQFPVSVVLQLGTKTVSTPNRPSATCAIAVGAAMHSGWVLTQSVCVYAKLSEVPRAAATTQNTQTPTSHRSTLGTTQLPDFDHLPMQRTAI